MSQQGQPVFIALILVLHLDLHSHNEDPNHANVEPR